MERSELDDMMAKDAIIDEIDVDKSARNIPVLIQKYNRILTDNNLALDSLQAKRKKLYRDKWLYYSGKAAPEVYQEKPLHLKILRNDLNIHILADDDIVKLDEEISRTEHICSAIGQTMGELNRRSFILKSILDHRKQTLGMNS